MGYLILIEEWAFVLTSSYENLGEPNRRETDKFIYSVGIIEHLKRLGNYRQFVIPTYLLVGT